MNGKNSLKTQSLESPAFDRSHDIYHFQSVCKLAERMCEEDEDFMGYWGGWSFYVAGLMRTKHFCSEDPFAKRTQFRC
ncbi:MAG: hypothetical protein MK008_01640 [Bdellovibrionales bacterium]|nr:hypothetical protein [Bdellovibrionales bacterium]